MLTVAPGSRSNRPSRHADPLAELYRSPATPRNPHSEYDRTARYQEPHDLEQPPHYNLSGRSNTHYDHGPPSGYSRFQDPHYGDHHHPRPFPGHQQEEQYEHEDASYEYDQRYRRAQRIEGVRRYPHDPRYDNDQRLRHDARYEQDDQHDYAEGDDNYEQEGLGEAIGPDEPSPEDHQPTMGGHISIQPGHPNRVSTQGELDPRMSVVRDFDEFQLSVPGYVVQDLDYFEPGKVFSILWHESDGRDGRANNTHVSAGPLFRGRYNQAIYSTIRRMVVLRAFDQHSWCYSISTYGGRGLAKPGVDPSKHAIVHMADTPPRLGSNEPETTKEPLEVDPERFDETLHPKSRLNFGKIYTVEHNVKVLPIGVISAASMPRFIAYARAELAI
ncbi:hypothetical protein BJX68DRAFT_230111 [Aspergillus pseudodeflectus]|uniref:DUF6590 domain-containing protein n=1 Tax=Aspergillus pseudodeflectus TaxID=176178 RepID=A0ABR4KV87_9EURO